MTTVHATVWAVACKRATLARRLRTEIGAWTLQAQALELAVRRLATMNRLRHLVTA